MKKMKKMQPTTNSARMFCFGRPPGARAKPDRARAALNATKPRFTDPLGERELGGYHGGGAHPGLDDQGGGGGQLLEVLRQPRTREFIIVYIYVYEW